ncbi:hypothetical protein [Subtercola sp. RTI3]|uniref:hypothetical protein n=1 Tax=Subtercola sp. RTI3 TaxID=3048639 RepID=UPI002B2318DD|nr:hypothetical protein [Subtercola sp. RTI3]MEA9986809.1 hypothetical protein [Subtercola sp. RTI3]
MVTPPPRRNLSAEERDQLRRNILTFAAAHPHRRRARRRLFGILTLAVVGAVGLAGTAWVVLSPPDVRGREVSCYQSADLNSKSITGQLYEGDPADLTGSTAIGQCRDLWERGFFGPGPIDTQTDHPDLVPPLVLCQQNDLSFAVFPAHPAPAIPAEPPADPTTFCHALGLEPGPVHPTSTP